MKWVLSSVLKAQGSHSSCAVYPRDPVHQYAEMNVVNKFTTTLGLGTNAFISSHQREEEAARKKSRVHFKTKNKKLTMHLFTLAFKANVQG